MKLYYESGIIRTSHSVRNCRSSMLFRSQPWLVSFTLKNPAALQDPCPRGHGGRARIHQAERLGATPSTIASSGSSQKCIDELKMRDSETNLAEIGI